MDEDPEGQALSQAMTTALMSIARAMRVSSMGNSVHATGPVDMTGPCIDLITRNGAVLQTTAM